MGSESEARAAAAKLFTEPGFLDLAATKAGLRAAYAVDVPGAPGRAAPTGPTDAEVDGWPDDVRKLWGDLHLQLDQLADTPDLDAAYDAIPTICRALALRAEDAPPGGQP